MKLDARRVEAFLRDPGAVRAVLLHGEDVGLVAMRGSALVRLVAGAVDEPFRVVEIERSGIGAIPTELASLSISGGRRVIRVREATDALVAPVRDALAGPGLGLLVLEAGVLPAASKLRQLIERHDDGVAIGCYPQDGAGLGRTIRDTLAKADVSAEEDAMGWLCDQLGGDSGTTRQELEKLALYAGAGAHVDLVMARRSVGDLAGLSVEDALFAATVGDIAGTDRALALSFAEGASPVGVLRQALGHVQRLARARAAMRSGVSAAEAARSVRPPLFFRRQNAFIRALSIWSEPALGWAAARVSDAERICKSTGFPAETICRQALMGMAQRGAAARR